ncbi:MAG: hypothetical protein SFX18_16420 [Pirellulales bacterium]|nr:hypothetical protein [Pirellulales bacterium]
MTLYAARNRALSQWLQKNPQIAGVVFILIGGFSIWTGVRALQTGEATLKWGIELEGTSARFVGGFWVLLGGGLAILGLVLLLGIWNFS